MPLRCCSAAAALLPTSARGRDCWPRGPDPPRTQGDRGTRHSLSWQRGGWWSLVALPGPAWLPGGLVQAGRPPAGLPGVPRGPRGRNTTLRCGRRCLWAGAGAGPGRRGAEAGTESETERVGAEGWPREAGEGGGGGRGLQLDLFLVVTWSADRLPTLSPMRVFINANLHSLHPLATSLVSMFFRGVGETFSRTCVHSSYAPDTPADNIAALQCTKNPSSGVDKARDPTMKDLPTASATLIG